MKAAYLVLPLFFLPVAWAASAPDKVPEIEIVPRLQPLKWENCLDCHRTGRLKGASPHVMGVFKHMHDVNQCSLCHHEPGMDRLNLLDGAPISLNDSPRLCGQCHGEVLGKWREGIHGRQTGMWNGRKSRLSCVACHEAHNPKFPAMKAVERPKVPRAAVLKGE